MGRYCLVPGCKSGDKRSQSSSATVHILPKRDSLAKLWIHVTKREGPINTKTTGVCSLHFSPEDYIRDLQFELLNPDQNPLTNPKKKLKDDAIPSQNLPKQKQDRPRPAGALTDRKERHTAIEEAQAEPSFCQDLTAADDQHDTAHQTSPVPGHSCPDPEELARLRQKVADLEKALKLRKEETDARDKEVAARYRDKLKNLFTDQQIDVLLNATRPCPWDDETVHKALVFRTRLSRRQYDFLRDEGMPLPSLTTLKMRLSNFKVSQGDYEFIPAMLMNYLRDKPDRDRPCVLMFDEMKVRNIADYDATGDQILGPHNYLQQVLLRSIVGTWRMPLYFAFDTAITKTLLEEMVKKVEAAGAKVVAVVSDLGGSNRGLWTALGITHVGKTSFPNPYDKSRNIWVFADTPHLYKLLRNHLLDNGLRLPDGGLLDKQLFADVLAIDAEKEFKILPKLGMESHLEVTGQARQKVRPAAQLLSGSVAAAAESFLGRHEEARYLRIFDNGFDALNGQCPTDLKPLRRGMKVGSSAHFKALAEMEEAMQLKLQTKTSLLPYQKGFVVTIKSMRGLVADIAALLGPDAYILPGRINQDILESFFSLVRGKGGANMNPSPSEAKCRVRSLALAYSLRLGVNPLTLSLTRPEDDKAVDDALLADFVDERPTETQEVDSDLQEVRSLLEEVSQSQPATSLTAASPVDPQTGVSAEQYGLAHAAGYVSAKCRKLDPSLGVPSAFASETASAETMWTRLRSQGGLSVPSTKWLEKFKDMESVFCTKHHLAKDGLCRKPQVIESLVEQLSRQRDSPDTRIVRRFVRLRTFIRLSYINRRLRKQALEERERRKRKQYLQ